MNKNNKQIASIRATAVRCRDAGLPLGETTLRALVRSGDLPATYVGQNKKRALIRWKDVIAFLKIEEEE